MKASRQELSTGKQQQQHWLDFWLPYFDETKPGELDTAITQLFNSDTEEEDFEGFIDEQLIKCSACVSFVCLQLTIMIFALE